MKSTVVSRTDGSIFGKWMWTVDRWLLGIILILAAFGIVMSFSSTRVNAERLGYDTYHFVVRHAFFLAIALVVMLIVSMQRPRTIRRLGVLTLLGSFGMMMLLPFFGTNIKGGTRWIYLFGVSVQPSEFAKPAFAVVTAWLMSLELQEKRWRAKAAAWAVFTILAGTLLSQPDVGMTRTVSAIFFAELFVSGLSMFWCSLLGFIGMVLPVPFYYTLPHFRARIDKFINPEQNDTFQIKTAMEAFKSGGFLGRGPAEGVVKKILPDAHTDFIFAVIAEEYGILICLAVVALFAVFIVRGLLLVMKDKNPFILYAVTGLMTQFGVQAFVNISSALGMIPTKGMTLPFISYGGSSLVSLGLAAGMILGLTRSSQRNDL